MPGIPKGSTVTTCECANCQKPNCGRCETCLNMKVFGGDGSRKERCQDRRCLIKAGGGGHHSSTRPRRGQERGEGRRPVGRPPTRNADNRSKKKRGRPPRAVAATAAAVDESLPQSPKKSRRTTKAPPPDAAGNSSDASSSNSGGGASGGGGGGAGRSSRRRVSASNANYRDGNIIRRVKCGKCAACLRDECGKCDPCLGKKRFGGAGHDRHVCKRKRCHVLYPQQKKNEEDEEASAKHDESESEMEEGEPAPAKNVASRPSYKRPRAAKGRPKKSKHQASSVDEMSSSSSSSSSSNSESSGDNSDKEATTKASKSSKLKRSGNSKAAKPSSVEENSVPNIRTISDYLASVEEKCVASDHDNRKPPPHATLYGLPIPKEAPGNVCSGCLGERDVELKDQPVLLCDGLNCGREFHLQCCVPQLLSIPPDTELWLCQDCSPQGSTASLVQYLESVDQAKSEFLRNLSDDVEDPEFEFVQHLLRKDSQEAGLPEDSRIPESEMERSGLTHSLALCDSLARTRGGNEGGHKPLEPDDYVGKPLRIFSTANQYHAGRIVDYRTRTIAPPSGNAMRDTEFLVRFTAGSGDRKTPHQHWITLEEHALAVGTTLVWAQIPAGVWNPSILWLRTARDLVPVQNLLNESEGEIHFVDADDTDKCPLKTKHKVFALARTFGAVEMFNLINVRDQSVDLFHQETINKHKNVDRFWLPLAMAKTEHTVQQRVRSWRSMPQENPVGHAVLSSRDSYTLPPLIPTNASSSRSIGSTHAKLCPNILRGLDRSKILDMLQRRGIDSTKDVAASLSCEILPVNAQTMQAERIGRNLR